MNRKEAMIYNENLKKELQQAALKCGLEESVGDYIVDNFITVLPEDARKGMTFLGKKSVSYKADNIKMDFKKALIAGLVFVSAINKPESLFNYIQLLIISAFFVGKSISWELSRLESYVVYLLHEKGAYDIGVEEERFISELQEWYHQKEGDVIGRNEVAEAINTLYEVKTIDLDSGNIYLKEHVWGKV